MRSIFIVYGSKSIFVMRISAVPDETTLCKFRHFPEENGLSMVFPDAANRVTVQLVRIGGKLLLLPGIWRIIWCQYAFGVCHERHS